MSSSQTPEMKVAKAVKKMVESLTQSNSHVSSETLSNSASSSSSSKHVSVSPVKVVKIKGKGKGGNVNVKGGASKGSTIGKGVKSPLKVKSEGFIDSIKTNVIKKIMTIVSHPKFKWIVAAILLCLLAFAYFKYQQHLKNKKLNATKKNLPQNINKAPQTVSHTAPQLAPPMPQMNQISNLSFNEDEIRKQYEAKLMQQQISLMQEQMNANTNKPAQKPKHVKIANPVDSTTEDESEEIFMEDQNVMKHNLTMDEMNALDKQLEDVNIDNIINSD